MKKYGLIAFVAALIVGFITASFYLRQADSDKSPIAKESYKTEIRELKDFTKVDASGSLNIVIVAGTDFKIELESERKSLDEIITELDGETLKIHFKKDWSVSKAEVAVRISMPTLEAAEISGNSKGVISNIKNKDLSIKLNGASGVKISGKTQNFNLVANGASIIEAETLDSENVKVEMNGSSNATLNASNYLEANTYGASSLKYIGNPKTVKEETSGASSIHKK
jgi:hypothetical protein